MILYKSFVTYQLWTESEEANKYTGHAYIISTTWYLLHSVGCVDCCNFSVYENINCTFVNATRVKSRKRHILN